MNRIASAKGMGDFSGVRVAIASSFFLLFIIAIFVFSTLSLVGLIFPFEEILNGGDPKDVRLAAMVFLPLFCIGLPISIFQRTQFALQMGHANGFVQAFGGVLSLFLTWLVSKGEAGLGGMVTAIMFAPILASLFGGVWMFYKHPLIRIQLSDIKLSEIKNISNSGLHFLALGVAFALCYTTDNLLISNVVGVEAVATYSVHQKYFSIIGFFATLVLTPLWPAYAEAISASDVAWVKRTFFNSLRYLSIVAFLGSGLLLILAPFAFEYWVAGHVFPNYPLLFGMAVWLVVDLIGKAVSIFLNGVGWVRQQMYIAMAFVPVCLSMKFFFVGLYGIEGLPLATVFAYLLVHFLPYFHLVRRWVNENHSGPF